MVIPFLWTTNAWLDVVVRLVRALIEGGLAQRGCRVGQLGGQPAGDTELGAGLLGIGDPTGQAKTGLLVPLENAAEAAVVEGLQVIPIRNLREAADFLKGTTTISPARVNLGLGRGTTEHTEDTEGDRLEL